MENRTISKKEALEIALKRITGELNQLLDNPGTSKLDIDDYVCVGLNDDGSPEADIFCEEDIVGLNTGTRHIYQPGQVLHNKEVYYFCIGQLLVQHYHAITNARKNNKGKHITQRQISNS